MLDAKSAFNEIQKESIIRNAYSAGSRGKGIIYLAERLGNKCTYVELGKVLMDSICDKIGFESGGCLSDRLYKLASNEQHFLPRLLVWVSKWMTYAFPTLDLLMTLV